MPFSYSSNALKPASIALSFSALETPRDRLPGFEHLVSQQFSIGEVQDRTHISNAGGGKYVVLLRIGCLHRFRSGCHRGAGIDASEIDERRMEHVDHGEEDHIRVAYSAT